MKLKLSCLLILAAVLFVSCWKKTKYSDGHFPENVVNFDAANSSADDFNMDLPETYVGHELRFSSNRASENNFDVVGEDMYIVWDYEDEALSIGISRNLSISWPVMRDSINTLCNELGPFSFNVFRPSKDENYWSNVLLYANDCDGNFDVKLVHTLPDESGVIQKVSAISNAGLINTTANELYPTLFGKNLVIERGYLADAAAIESVIYCSDSDGQFDLFEMWIDKENDFIRQLQSGRGRVPLKLDISSEGNDKCPFISGRTMVFASDRPGGFGGFDLYYSVFGNNGWSTPVNFGETINSAYDDYRPVLLTFDLGFDNSLLLFSSNRPGGKGGFDLYYVGVDDPGN